MTRFLVFTRADRHPWLLSGDAQSELSTAVRMANDAVLSPASGADRAVVMEVSGVDAMPMFSYRFGAKR